MSNPIDDITQEVEALTDEQLAEAAAKIQARQAQAKARMTPERVQKQKDREKHRRQLNAAILKAAKAKNLVPSTTEAPVEGAQA